MTTYQKFIVLVSLGLLAWQLIFLFFPANVRFIPSATLVGFWFLLFIANLGRK